jgi:ATP-dependent RNA helicase DDX49/DBP8
VFIATCKECQLLYLALKFMGLKVACLHSSMKQVKRMANLAKFRSGQSSILVTTDSSARGLDIPEVRLVINYSLPKVPADYVHRAGRTARAGREGLSLTLLRPCDISRLQKIEEYTGIQMTELQVEEGDVLLRAKIVMKALRDAKIYMLDSGITEKLNYLQTRKLEQK